MTGRTPLTYYGGKQRLAAQIAALLPPHRVYLEPFAGGAAVLFAKPRAERETLNDLDGTVVRFWRALRDRPDELAAAVGNTPYSREEWRSAAAAEAEDDVEAARLLVVEIDQSFSRSRESWSPPTVGSSRGRWQPDTWRNLPPKLLAAAERLQGVALEHGDALELIARWDVPGCVIYCDPPYAGSHRLAPGHGYRVEGEERGGPYTQGSVEELWDSLVGVLAKLEHAAVALSGYPCEQAERLGWTEVRMRSRRTVQARPGNELELAPECVWLSPAAEQSQQALDFGAAT